MSGIIFKLSSRKGKLARFDNSQNVKISGTMQKIADSSGQTLGNFAGVMLPDLFQQFIHIVLRKIFSPLIDHRVAEQPADARFAIFGFVHRQRCTAKPRSLSRRFAMNSLPGNRDSRDSEIVLWANRDTDVRARAHLKQRNTLAGRAVGDQVVYMRI
jgi:hypothetical protein